MAGAVSRASSSETASVVRAADSAATRAAWCGKPRRTARSARSRASSRTMPRVSPKAPCSPSPRLMEVSSRASLAQWGRVVASAGGTVTFVTPAVCMASVTRTEKRILSALTRALISLSACVSASSRPTPLRSNSSTVRRMRRAASAPMTAPSASRAACPSGAWDTSSSSALKRR